MGGEGVFESSEESGEEDESLFGLLLLGPSTSEEALRWSVVLSGVAAERVVILGGMAEGTLALFVLKEERSEENSLLEGVVTLFLSSSAFEGASHLKTEVSEVELGLEEGAVTGVGLVKSDDDEFWLAAFATLLLGRSMASEALRLRVEF